MEKAIDRAKQNKMASQFSLFAISNESVIDEIREFDVEKMSADEVRKFLSEIKRKIV